MQRGQQQPGFEVEGQQAKTLSWQGLAGASTGLRGVGSGLGWMFVPLPVQ